MILESVKWKTEAIKKSSDMVSYPWLPKSNNFLSELFTKKKKERRKEEKVLILTFNQARNIRKLYTLRS